MNTYIVYYGPASRTYMHITNFGNVTLAAVPRLAGVTFYAVTAVNASGLESEFSNEVALPRMTE